MTHSDHQMKNGNEEPVVIFSNGSRLIGVLHHAKGNCCIILCHGFTGQKTENKRLFVEAARTFAENGFTALRFDFYGSGDSEGEFEESRLSVNIQNLRDVISWCRDQGFSRLAVLGISMGAATAILTVGSEKVDALVCWSAVPDTKRLFAGYLPNLDEIKQLPERVEYDGWLIQRDFFLDALKYDVETAFADLSLPKFIVQGTADAPLFVEGFRRFQEVAQPPADFMEIPGAGHTFQTPHHRKQVVRQTLIWLQRQF
ncbi:MAG: alpha/beta fold hydrolase [candidate division KSB1 bacterium]|nr:alpha/beta fold hydrolase [candidate division KSB1 bacterium]